MSRSDRMPTTQPAESITTKAPIPRSARTFAAKTGGRPDGHDVTTLERQNRLDSHGITLRGSRGRDVLALECSRATQQSQCPFQRFAVHFRSGRALEARAHLFVR